MYAITIKATNRSSWQMERKVYDDREKCDAVIKGMKIALAPYKITRIYFDLPDD